MLRGDWHDEASTDLVVADTGKLMGGGHRLRGFIMAAAVKPDLRITFRIKYGLTEEEAFAVQANTKAFTAKAYLELAGINPIVGPAARLVLTRGANNTGAFSEDIRDQSAKYEKPIAAVLDHLQQVGSRKKVAIAGVAAAVTRALISRSERKDDILRFCDIVAGKPNVSPRPFDDYPQKLARIILQKQIRTTEDVKYTYLVTEFALQGFLERAAPIDKLRVARGELFPLRNEPDPNEKPIALLIPAPYGHAIGAIETKRLSLNVQRYRAIKPGSAIYVCGWNARCHRAPDPRTQRIVAVGRGKLAISPKGLPEIEFSVIGPVDAPPFDYMTLMKLSCAQRRIPTLEQFGRMITQLTKSDIEALEIKR